MRVPLSWLGELVDLPASLDDLVECLTCAGLEVDGVERTGPDLEGVRVGHVLEKRPHPNADRLSVCVVDAGEAEPFEVICGAPNVEGGQRIAFAPVGTRLPDGTKLKRAKIRGVTSSGMICSERELGLSEEHEGILVLAKDAPVGAPLADVIPAGEVVLDLGLTPNRGDWASLLGVAREVRAHFGGSLRLPPCVPPESGPPAERDVTIEIEDREGCFRYAGRVVRGISVGPSPDWVRVKLEAAGLRSINNVVDATNLVLLELGQPLHAFDLATLRGARALVRRAREGEKLVTLDGQTRALSAEDLVIADAERAIALAGVMGGAETEVREATADVLIESAHFAPGRVRRTARHLGLVTDASYRFERGVDREGVERAADRCATLLVELAGGSVAPGRVVALGAEPPATAEVTLEPERVSRLLGTALAPDDIAALLERLDLPSTRDASGRLVCRVPSWRNDLHIPVDLVEEVARVHGYHRIEATLPEGRLEGTHAPPLRRVIEAARDSLVAAGFCEVMSFPSRQRDDSDRLRLADGDARRSGLRLQNPLAEDEAELRTSLVPGLLRMLRLNLARQADRVRIFEASPVFLPRGAGELPDERLYVAALLTRGEPETLWEAHDPTPLFFEAKGVAEQLLADLGLEPRLEGGEGPPYLHPGAANRLGAGGATIGAVGEIHPEVAARFEIEEPCAILELELARVPELPAREIACREVSRQPSARRDLAYLFDADRPAGEILEAIRRSGGSSLVSVRLFDRYAGKGIPQGKVSLAFRLQFQRPDRTLTDEEVNRQLERVENVLSSRLGGVRR